MVNCKRGGDEQGEVDCPKSASKMFFVLKKYKKRYCFR